MPYWFSGYEMERQIAKKLAEHGFDVTRNVKVGSLSLDILVKDKMGNYVIIEAKEAPVGSIDVAKVRAILHDFPFKGKKIGALILTSRSATTDARKLAKRIGVKIISDSSLPRLSEKVLNSLREMTQVDLIKSLFIPETCLQGVEVPVHLLWEKGRVDSVKVFFPEKFLGIKEIYNVKAKGLKYEHGVLDLADFEVDGYLGLVFKAKVYKEPLINTVLKFIVLGKNNIRETLEKKVFLFRPHLLSVYMPSKILLTLGKDGYIKLHEKICLKNEGKGTAIVHVKVKENSEVRLKRPEDISEFMQRFYGTWINGLNKLKGEFKDYSQLIEDFIDFIQIPVEFTKNFLTKLERVYSNLSLAFESNEDFLYSFGETILRAYLSSVHMVTEIHSLLEYLTSITTERVLLVNAMSFLEMKKKGANKFRAELTVTDLASNYYKPIDVTLDFEVKDPKVRVPLYSIFKWEGA